MRGLLNWLLWAGWYALVAGGWLCWFAAHQRAERLRKELTVMAHSWRYATRKDR